jgi:2-phosphosulfolactate phosphatase
LKKGERVVEIRLGERGVQDAAQRNDIIVVVDVLRASSTIITAIDNGALSIVPATTVGQARKLARIISNSILGGERKALRIPGFALGNSPLEYTPEIVRDKNIILTTTNCTRILESCKELQHSSDVLIGAFLNATSVAETAQRLARRKERGISIIQAGVRGKESQDDLTCAELIRSRIEARTQRHMPIGSRSIAGLSIYAILSNTNHGKYLMRMGFEHDVDYCSQVDTTATVPRLSNIGGTNAVVVSAHYMTTA